MVEITLTGQTPSQKNNKQIQTNRKTGKPFIASNSRVKRWQRDMLDELQYFKYKVKGRVQIDYMFYVKDLRERDIDNMIASVNDLLQVANAETIVKNGRVKPKPGTGIIEGDSWQMLRIGSADAALDRENPRAEIKITPIDPIN